MTDHTIPTTSTHWAILSGLQAGTGTLTLLQPQNHRQLNDLLQQPHPKLHVVGNGTNLIGTDADGLTAIKLPPTFPLPDHDRPLRQLNRTDVMVSAAIPLPRLLRNLAHLGLGGFHQLAGIPGTVGGAITMNAGALGCEIKDTVLELHGLSLKDGSRWAWSSLTDSLAPWAYRTSPVPHDILLTHALLRLAPVSPEAERLAIRQELARRVRVTPRGSSIGSIFRNPPGDYAGRLLQEAGCQAMSEGPFSVSSRHANWIVNLSHQPGSARDCLTLIHRMREAVRQEFHLDLIPEGRCIP